MNDRELLELAAKAAGLEGEYKILRHSRRDHFKQIRHFSREAFVSKGIVWDPLNDDGDALRLAIKLGICITFIEDHDSVGAEHSLHGVIIIEAMDDFGTRRAIVRAAAEIGRVE